MGLAMIEASVGSGSAGGIDPEIGSGVRRDVVEKESAFKQCTSFFSPGP